MNLVDFAAAATIVATIFGTSWRVLAKLNAIDMELLKLRTDLSDFKRRLAELERHNGKP